MKGDLWSLGPTPNGTACHWRSRATKKLCRGLFKIWPHISTMILGFSWWLYWIIYWIILNIYSIYYTEMVAWDIMRLSSLLMAAGIVKRGTNIPPICHKTTHLGAQVLTQRHDMSWFCDSSIPGKCEMWVLACAHDKTINLLPASLPNEWSDKLMFSTNSTKTTLVETKVRCNSEALFARAHLSPRPFSYLSPPPLHWYISQAQEVVAKTLAERHRRDIVLCQLFESAWIRVQTAVL